MRFLASGFLFATMLITAACSSSDPVAEPDAQFTAPVLPASPVLSFDKKLINVSGLQTDQESVHTFLVINGGGETLVVGLTEVIATSEGCDAITVPDGMMEIPVGRADLLFINVGTDCEPGSHKVNLSISSNDPLQPRTELVMRLQVSEPPKLPESASIGPRLRLGKRSIDIGAIPAGQPLYEEWVMRNTGDAQLVFEAQPGISVLEGCCPPEVVVGAETLAPGEATYLALPLMGGLVGGTDGPYDFEVAIKSNDAVEPVQTLNWSFEIQNRPN